MRSTSPSEAAIPGSAVETMVWSTAARNIGSMIDGKTAKNSRRASVGDGRAAVASRSTSAAVAAAASAPEGMRFSALHISFSARRCAGDTLEGHKSA